MKTICIRMDDEGQFSVGEMPSAGGMGAPPMAPEGEMGAAPAAPEMQPAEDLDAALAMAAGLLEADPAQELENESAFMDGYKETEGGANRMMPEQAVGPTA